MRIYAKLSVNSISQDDCSSVDLAMYSYVIKFCSAEGDRNILKSEPKTNFSSDGKSQLHSFEYSDFLSEIPLAWCDIYCGSTITDSNIYINLFYNSDSSNQWTVFNKKFTKGETTKNASYDKICNISNHRIFIDSQFPVGDPLDPFEKSKIERQLNNRLKYLSSPQDYMFNSYSDQSDSSLCGPATFLYALLNDRPDLYSQYIKDLWNVGKAILGSLEIIPSQGCRHPTNYTSSDGQTRVPAIDWISMASLRDDMNFSDYSSPDEEFSGITMPSAIVEWATGVGSKIIFNNMGLGALAKYMIIEISNYVSSENHVAVLINDGLLKGYPSKGPTHWIIWDSKIISVSTKLPVDEYTPDTDLVDLSVFSWGGVKKMSSFRINRTRPFKEFCGYIYGAVVFEKIR